MSSLRALVVGGTSGVGKGIALSLAKNGHNVVIAGRSTTRGAQIVTELEKCAPKSRHSFQAVNAFDLKSVKDLANAVTTEPIDLLVMTQGMATTQGFTPTVDKFDQKLQLHYFSRLYLAKLIAPKMQKKSRILIVLSAGVHGRYENFQNDFELKENYSLKNAADAAGFYSDAGFEQISNEFPQLVVCHAAPGFVNTNWGAEMPWYLKGIIRGLQPLGRSYQKCGSILTEAWLNLPHDNDGENYFLMDQNGNVIEDGLRHTKEEGKIIWDKTLALLPTE